MKKGDLVKAKDYQFKDYGIGIVIASDQLGSLKVYWLKNNCWSITSSNAMRKI
jgi:hypothetical protein